MSLSPPASGSSSDPPSPFVRARIESDPTPPHISLTPPTTFREIKAFFSHEHDAERTTLLESMSLTSKDMGIRGRPVVTISASSSRETSRDSRDSSSSLFKFSPRPWKGTPSKKHSVPKEQTDAYLRTKARVDLAAKSIGEVIKTGLEVVSDAGETIPVPGLGAVARLLLGIWNALDKVGSNRLSCLRLTGRCADLLLAIYEEIHEAGKQVLVELAKPLDRLEYTFTQIFDLLTDLKDRPFWKRYLEREEILSEIDRCNEALHDCLYLFNMSIVLRVLKNVRSSTNQSVSESKETLLLEKSVPDQAESLSPIEGIEELGLTNFSAPPPVADDMAVSDADRIRERLRLFQERQNELDKAKDMTDLRELLRAALDATNDREMQKVLQVASKDMPQAIKTLLWALEGQNPKYRPPPSSAMRSTRALPRTRAFTWPMDEKQSAIVDGELIETEIVALQRFTQGYELDLPSWTIQKGDIAFQELIGRGFFSNVYKGTWRHRVVAIKVLEPSTPRSVFEGEMSLWRSMNHPNALRLYGASELDGELPWFLVSPYMRNGSLTEYLKRLEWDGSMHMGKSLVSEVYGDSSEPDLLRFMIEIATGMEYLHNSHIVHGDLKGANVLVDNNLHCVLADFGHSKPLSQITYTSAKHAHGLRWQSPELMAERSLLTKENDVYAFAITCVEIVTMGSLPWPMTPDDLVKKYVLEQDQRPPFPSKIVDWLGIRNILYRCWTSGFMERPTFSRVVEALERALENLSNVEVGTNTEVGVSGSQTPLILSETSEEPARIKTPRLSQSNSPGGATASSSRDRDRTLLANANNNSGTTPFPHE